MIMGSGFETAEAFACLPLPRFMARWKGTRTVNRIDLTGQKFGRLVAEEWVPAHDGVCGKWRCKCDCGNISFVLTNSLRCGNTISCGCGRIDSIRKKKLESRSFQGAYTKSHRPRLYWVWLNMVRRCENPKSPDYYRYGGRGIEVCEKWHGLGAFLDWAYSNGWEEGLTLDRIDNEGPYCPDNCRWTDRSTQCNNMRNNVRYAYDGKLLTIPQWAKIVGVPKSTLYCRIYGGWSIEDALTKPVKKYNTEA